jgi:hypothetical protein
MKMLEDKRREKEYDENRKLDELVNPTFEHPLHTWYGAWYTHAACWTDSALPTSKYVIRSLFVSFSSFRI